jgi:single-strand DNA-binding protein
MSNVFSAVVTVSKDAEIRYLQSGTAILTFNAANNVGYGDKQKTNWLRVSLFGKRAEGRLIQFLKKGQSVFVSGELLLNEFEKEGIKHQSLELNAQIVDLVGKKGPTPNSDQIAPAAAGSAPSRDSYDDWDADEIPF